ncbi:MAG TPA: alpha/beta fold hydrolase [Polyangia bacterium]|nr:alpha/beta fold hydrolase [Polyangia bacterium]
MSTFVLVHGSFHGGWCWERVVPELVALGHRALAPDLPGRGGDATQTLDAYARSIGEVIAAQAEPVVLVGHSMGGVVITAVAERMPERLARLVYVCAFLPASGQSLLELAKSDTESALMPALVIDEASGLHHVRADGARVAFYHDCAEADAERAIARLGREPLAVVAAPVATTAERFGRVPRTYVECTDDRALGPSLQRRMHAAQPCRVERLASSHSPFYSQPAALARLLAG